MKPLYTLKGSKIQRYKNNVGKEIYKRIYVHRDYMLEVIPTNVLERAIKCVSNRSDLNLSYNSFNTVVYDLKDESVRFDSSTNFDIEREPCAGNYITVFANGRIKEGKTKSIWHHKWLWVKDDYTGFDIGESYSWSKTWLSKTILPSGLSRVWKNQLKKVGLI